MMNMKRSWLVRSFRSDQGEASSAPRPPGFDLLLDNMKIKLTNLPRLKLYLSNRHRNLADRFYYEPSFPHMAHLSLAVLDSCNCNCQIWQILGGVACPPGPRRNRLARGHGVAIHGDECWGWGRVCWLTHNMVHDTHCASHPFIHTLFFDSLVFLDWRPRPYFGDTVGYNTYVQTFTFLTIFTSGFAREVRTRQVIRLGKQWE